MGEGHSDITGDLASDLLNSLTASIAVLDEAGTIVAVNNKWKSFARRNGGDEKTFYVGTNYLNTCELALNRRKDEVAETILHGIHELLDGKRDELILEYPCHSPDEKHWFIARITRFSHKGSTYVVAAHEDITTRKLAE